MMMVYTSHLHSQTLSKIIVTGFKKFENLSVSYHGKARYAICINLHKAQKELWKWRTSVRNRLLKNQMNAQTKCLSAHTTHHIQCPLMYADGWYRLSLFAFVWQIFVRISIHSFSSTQLLACNQSTQATQNHVMLDISAEYCLVGMHLRDCYPE
jgi:hypothetical protein